MIILDWNQTNRKYLKIGVEKKWGSEMGMLPDPPVPECRRIGGRAFLPVTGTNACLLLEEQRIGGRGEVCINQVFAEQNRHSVLCNSCFKPEVIQTCNKNT